MITALKEEFETTKSTLFAEQERIRNKLQEELNEQHANEKKELENVLSLSKEAHTEEVSTLQEQSKNRYAELKHKVQISSA